MRATIRLFLINTVVFFAVGLLPQAQALTPPPDGGYPGANTAEGQNALLSLTTGGFNTAVGYYSLRSTMANSFNTAIGAGALFANTGENNTATGVGTLFSNNTGAFNTSSGAFALFSNTTGDSNVADGHEALFSNILGSFNIAIGRDALHANTEGFANVAIGNGALYGNTTSDQNTAVGFEALDFNVTGNNNTALGNRAGSNVTGNGNVCIGEGVVGTTGIDDTTYIRNVNTLVQNFSPGVNDYVTVRLSDGRLGHTAVVSSQRYKENIKSLAAASDALYALRPVSFRLKKEFDSTQTLGFGLVAEEVEKVNGDLVYRNDKGQVESVRYEMVNAMLLNEFLKEHRKVQEQEATIAQLKKDMENVLARLREHDTKIQRVSGQMQLRKPVPQVVSVDR